MALEPQEISVGTFSMRFETQSEQIHWLFGAGDFVVNKDAEDCDPMQVEHSISVKEGKLTIDAGTEAIRSDEDLKIYTSGTNNILKYPELTDNREKTSELINVFEEKKALGELVQDSLSEENNTGIQVYIGNETPVSSMKDCSVVTATYELGEGMRGTIGIIGPKRMDYDKVIGTLKTLMNELDTLYKK